METTPNKTEAATEQTKPTKAQKGQASKKGKKPVAKRKGAIDSQNHMSQKKSQLRGRAKFDHSKKDKYKGLGVDFWESVPFIKTTFSLGSTYIQQAFTRNQRSFAVNAYLAEVYPSARTWQRWPEIIKCVEVLMDHSERDTKAMLTEIEAQTRHMMEVLCLDENELQVTNELEVTYAITTPRVAQYIHLLKQADRVAQNLQRLWLADGAADANYVRHESLRIRSKIMKHAGTLYRQSDRIRRVINGTRTIDIILKEMEDEISQYIGRGLKEKDEQGNSLLLEGEKDIQGPMIGEPAKPEQGDQPTKSVTAPKPTQDEPPANEKVAV